MERNIRVRGIRRKQIDEDKLALAFLLLAKILHEQEVGAENAGTETQDRPGVPADDNKPEAA